MVLFILILTDNEYSFLLTLIRFIRTDNEPYLRFIIQQIRKLKNTSQPTRVANPAQHLEHEYYKHPKQILLEAGYSSLAEILNNHLLQ
jgi:hypothetical protein